VLGNCLYQFFFAEGVARTRAGNAALVLAAVPVLIAAIGRMLGVERIGARGIGGIVLSVAGIALVVFGGTRQAASESTVIGDLLVLAGAICWSVFTVLLKPYTHRVSLSNISALTMAGGAIPLVLVSTPAIVATDWGAVAPLTWAAIVYSGLGALVIAYLFWYRGVRVLGPTRTAVYSNLQPVIALLVAWPALSEVPTLWQGVGAGTIIAGVILTRT
jgi:drug/metabolite transporter (DMT)-like permease